MEIRAFPDVPVNRLLGFELRASGADGAVVALVPRPDQAQEYGVVHGGILSALADTAAVYTLLPGLAAEERMTSIEFKVNFLAAAWPEKGELVATATMVRRGRTIAVVQSDVRQGDVHVLTGVFTYMIIPRP